MVQVNLNQSASVKGVIKHATERMRGIYSFMGIPYAEPPVGKLRFKPPKPVNLWKGVRDCSKFGSICPQNIAPAKFFYQPYEVPTEMNEDCLFLNVFTPVLQRSSKLPVMVWIHGGAFQHGFSDYYDGTSICTFNDVVVVSLNYRVGVLGFLATGDGAVNGNMGLLDQVEALRWVQKYITNFGGDPNNVTLFGESAGGISIAFHILSPLTQDLFHKAICQSGVSTHPGSLWPLQNSRKFLLKRLKDNGCEETEGHKIVEYLSSLSADEIMTRLGEGFQPVVDGGYMTDSPTRLYSQGKFNRNVDLMLGFTENEGAVFIFGMVLTLGLTKVESLDTAKTLVDFIVDKSLFRGAPNQSQIKEVIIKEYLKGAQSHEEFMKGLIEMYGDLLFVAPSIDILNKHVVHNKGKNYLYKFTYKPEFFRYPDWVGADHGQEIVFVFGEPFLGRFKRQWKTRDQEFSKQMMKMWCNFASTGNPNGGLLVDWLEYNETTGDHVILHPDPEVKVHPHQPGRMKIWNEVISDLVKSPEKAKY